MQHCPFDGLVVVELGARIGVSACGSLFAAAGATVIVVEPENLAAIGKFKFRASSLAGKESVVVRVGNAEDEELLRQLLEAADVVIRSSDFGPDFAAGIVLGSDTVDCDILAFPTPEPAGTLFDDKLIQAQSGIAAVTGTADGGPTISEAAILDLGAGVYAAAAITAALRMRRLHGGGQKVASTLYGTGVNGMVTFLPFFFDGKIPPRGGNRHPMAAPWNAYQASDGWILLCSANDDQWRRLCSVMGRPELAEEGDLVKLAGRVKNVDATDAIVQSWVGTKTVKEAVETLGRVDIAAGPIVAVDELAEEPNVNFRGMVRRLRDPETGLEVAVANSPFPRGRVPSAIPLRNSGRELVHKLEKRPSATRGSHKQAMPLKGLRVLEIGQYTTAPLAAKQMATLGADVIKIEPLTGESSRAWPPHLNGESYFFTMNNANKRSLAIDLRTPNDRALLTKLIGTSDILVENLKPGSLARLGFSFEEIQKINSRLVYCAISGYGADSAYPGRPAFDTVIQAMSGLMDLTRSNGIPTKLGISIADTLGGMMGLFCILAMLEERDRTGTGSFIDLAMQDVGVWATHTAWDPNARSPHAIVGCNDGHLAVLCPPENVFTELAKADIDPGSVTREQAAMALLARGIPAASIRAVDEVGRLESRTGGMIRMVDCGRSCWPLIELPFNLSRMPHYDLKPIGSLGEANRELAGNAP